MIDLKSKIDVTSRMSPSQARKILSEMLNRASHFISFTKHARQQMVERDLRAGDVLNVLKAGNIWNEPEFENGSFRYKVSTSKIIVVIAFRKAKNIVIITAWRV